MIFDFSEDQRIIDDSITRLLRERYRFEQRAAYIAEPIGWSRDIWSIYADLGLLALPFQEESGGLGAGAVEMMIVAQRMGYHLTVEPWLATIVLGGGALRHGARGDLATELFADIISGRTMLAFASEESQARCNIEDVRTRAVRDGAAWILRGRKELVIHGATADYLVVTARTSGDDRDRAGISLFLVEAKAEGLAISDFPTYDGQRSATVLLNDVRVDADRLIGIEDEGFDLARRVTDEAIAALAAEAVGAMEAAIDLTVQYLKDRRQFGRAIGSFQVLQHRAADMMIALEQARSMAILGAMACSIDDPIERQRQIAAVKVDIGRHSRFVGQQAVQLHGGIGMAMEHAAGHYLRRLVAIDQCFGDSDHQIARLADLGGVYPTC